MVNAALPEKYRDYSRTLGKSETDAMLAQLAVDDPEKYKDVAFRLVQLGRQSAFEEGTTLRLSDVMSPVDKTPMLAMLDEQESRIDADPNLTDDERRVAREDLYSNVNEALGKLTYDAALANGNMFAMQVKSKARGNRNQLTALLTTPGTYEDAKDRVIPGFIRSSYAEGLKPHEYFSATYGARKGIISSKFATRDAGYLGKLMGAAVIDEVVSESDCGTPYGLPVPADDDDNIGTVLSRPTAGFSAGTVITKDVMDKIKAKKIDTIVVRSPLTCGSKAGVCKHCVGMREGNKFPELGYHAGLSASQAIAEPIAQMGLNVKHSGKKAKGQTTYSGFKVLKNMATVPATYPDSATASELDGRVTKIDAAAQGGWHVYIGDVAHYVPHDKPLLVKEGDDVEAGDQLSDGVVNPSDVVRLKGLGEGRRYFTERFTRAMRDSNININRRNVELLSRALVNHVQVDDMDDDGGHLPGDVVQYGSWAFGHKPRKDSVRLDPRKAIGKYLDEPALHYTIGTRITKSVADRLANTGTMDVLAAQKAPGVSPVMVSVVRTPEYTDDWMARLGTSYLKTRLLEDVHSGSTSNLHGVNPLPGIAKGVEFGVNKPGAKTFTY